VGGIPSFHIILYPVLCGFEFDYFKSLVCMFPLFTVLQTTIKSVAVVDTVKSVKSGTMAKSKAWIVFK